MEMLDVGPALFSVVVGELCDCLSGGGGRVLSCARGWSGAVMMVVVVLQASGRSVLYKVGGGVVFGDGTGCLLLVPVSCLAGR